MYGFQSLILSFLAYFYRWETIINDDNFLFS